MPEQLTDVGKSIRGTIYIRREGAVIQLNIEGLKPIDIMPSDRNYPGLDEALKRFKK